MSMYPVDMIQINIFFIDKSCMKHFKIQTIDLTNVDSFIEELGEKFSNHDCFQTSQSFDLKPHYHSDFESRLFLEGEATFTVYGEEIHCTPGTYIEIYPDVVHSFEYVSPTPLKVLRFFSEEEDWKATFV